MVNLPVNTFSVQMSGNLYPLKNRKVMKKLKTLIYLLLFGSCTVPVTFTRTEPPDITLPEKPAMVFFSNQFDWFLNPGIKDKHEAAYETGINSFTKALTGENHRDSPFLNFVADRRDSAVIAGKLFGENMDSVEIRTICRDNDAGFLLSLDSLRLNFDWEVIREEESDGSVSKTKNFYLLSNYYVTLYDSSGRVIRRTLLGKSIPYTSRPTLGALITILPNLANGTEKIKILAAESASEYRSMFYPREVTAGYKKLYTGRLFMESNDRIMASQFNKAIEMLENMPYTTNPAVMKKIQHNLSVAKELRDYYENRGKQNPKK
jgi:hypothetical protein